MTATAAIGDGRRLRREHNRQTVVEALVGLFDDGVYEPSSAQIAERAGLSPRSLFRYFDDVDDLTRAAIERQLSTARPLLHIDAGADEPLRRRIDKLVDARIRLYDAITPGARAARICAHRNRAVADHLREARSHWRKQVEQLFAEELRHNADLLPALDVLCSFESYELLRHAQRMTRAATAGALVAAMSALLDPTGERP